MVWSLMAVLLSLKSARSTLMQYGPSTQAVALQDAIDASIARAGASSFSVAAGDYYFGNASLVIHRAFNFTLRAQAGPGTVQLWFSIGAGVLVNRSSDVVLDGLSVDYDPPAHWQGTITSITDDGMSSEIQAFVQTDPGFLHPLAFNAAYRMGMPGVQSAPGQAMVWNATDPGFGAFAGASWPPNTTAGGQHVFNVSRASLCTDIRFTTTDGSSCLVGGSKTLRQGDKITAHLRAGYTLHILNSTRVHTRHSAIHGAPGFAITEYDGPGAHSYYNVSVGRRHAHTADAARTLCGVSNPTGGRLCLSMIASNNDALHSSGCKVGPTFTSGELSYCLDDWINIHSRGQVVLERVDARHLVMIDPRLNSATSEPDDFPYGNVETLTNARPRDQISFFISGNLTRLGSAVVHSTRRANWVHDATVVSRAQRLLGQLYGTTCGLDAGLHCRAFGCEPRVWYVAFDSDIPAWETASTRGIVASLDSWSASGAVVTRSQLHHGRFGVRWKSSDATITANRISARYMEISPLEYYMEGPFRLSNITVADNTFADCAAPAASFAAPTCSNDTSHLPLGYWRRWCSWGGGCGGVCKAAAVGASQLDAAACADVKLDHNKV